MRPVNLLSVAALVLMLVAMAAAVALVGATNEEPGKGAAASSGPAAPEEPSAEWLEQSAQKAEQEIANSRANYFSKFKDIFNFSFFTSIYQKQYRSLVERLRRQKMFMARAFRVFVAAVKYIFRKATFYLAINPMSDRTIEEAERMRNKKIDSKPLAEYLKEAQEQGNDGFIQVDPALNEASEQLQPMEVEEQEQEEEQPHEARELSAADLIKTGAEWKVQAFGIPSALTNFLGIGKKRRERPEDVPHYKSITGYLDKEGDLRHQLNLAVLASFKSPDYVKRRRVAGAMNKRNAVYIDHRESGCLFSPRDQYDCGSCYAFATVAAMEWNYCMETGRRVAMSEQYLVDCGFRLKLDGCNGATLLDTANFYKNMGMERRSDYPYVKHDNNDCPYPLDAPTEKLGRFTWQDSTITITSRLLVERWLDQSPVIYGMFGQLDSFAEYGGGVYDDPACPDYKFSHAVLIVGHGKEDGHEYWLIRNSYGVRWGELGYMKLSKESRCNSDAAFVHGYGNFRKKSKIVWNKNRDDQWGVARNYINTIKV